MKTQNFNKKISDTNVRIGEARFCYVHVFTPQLNDDGTEGKYQVQVLIPKTDKAALAMIESAINGAKEKGKFAKWGGKIPNKLNNPLHDGDEERDSEEYEGMMYLNASCKNKPGVMVLEDGKRRDALGDDDFYSGCWGAITLNFSAYDNAGNRGVGCYMNNVIKTRDDERLAGGASAESDFGDLGEAEEVDALS